ncbi:MAG: UDP-N-acetylmuramate--L-alanine ligase [Patescibacteria group bacterium]|nr:UDP-N-acetylmuramate--L-alanine ligase [Patescibacteria group bacterium]
MNIRDIRSAHFVGIGGINMSAVAKLLLSQGVAVSGSDKAENEQVLALRERGAKVFIGHSTENVTPEADVVIHTSAAPENNPEREEARRRGIPEMTNFRFLGEWFKDEKTILVTGTHGKSTTTGMLGLMLIEAGLDPNVILGSKLPQFVDGNLRLSTKHEVRGTNMSVIEGDEYARHFLEFNPYAVLINNIELDHTDIYPTLEDYVGAFRELLTKMKDGGFLVANVGDGRIAGLLRRMQEELRSRRITIVTFLDTDEADGAVRDAGFSPWKVSHKISDGLTEMQLSKDGVTYRFFLRVHGSHNVLDAAGAALMAMQLGAPYEKIAVALDGFKGIWRRFESLGEFGGAKIFSDYGHHPTAVAATLSAARELYPASRIVLCFQPHHRNRTKNLFKDFVPSFDAADVLVLCEIYDVAGRDASEDADISSRQLVEAVKARDEERGVGRLVEYAENPASSIAKVKDLAKPGDVVIIMGAGDIDDAARKEFITK